MGRKTDEVFDSMLEMLDVLSDQIDAVQKRVIELEDRVNRSPAAVASTNAFAYEFAPLADEEDDDFGFDDDFNNAGWAFEEDDTVEEINLGEKTVEELTEIATDLNARLGFVLSELAARQV